MRRGRVKWASAGVLLGLLALGGAALAQEGGAADGVAGGAATGTENILEATVTDEVYGAACQRTVGGVALRTERCDGRATRQATLTVTFPDLPAGTVVNLAVHRPGQNKGRGYLVRGDGSEKQVRLDLLPGVNVITVSVNNEVAKFRVIRVAAGQRLRAFRDASRHWARPQIDQLAALGVFDGYLDGQDFAPDAPATRGDVAWFLDKIVNVDAADASPAGVPADSRRHRAAPAIRRVMQQGLMKGVGQGRFAPEVPLTRAQVATLLDRALPPIQVSVDIDAEFRDGRQVPAWARESMARMRARGLVSGYEDGTLRPDRTLTRGELATLLSRFMEYRNRQGR